MATALHHLVFCSTAQVELTDEELVLLLHKARAYNQRHHITGMLLYHASQFVAVLEGPVQPVRALYERTCTDARHHNVLLLSDGPTSRRTFPAWHMGFVTNRPEVLVPPPADYINPQRAPCLRDHAPTANPYLLNMLREFIAVRPGEPA